MGRLRGVALLVCTVAMLVPASTSGAKPAPKPGLILTMSNFRFCQAETCTPFDVGYLRPGDAPIEGSDNSLAAVDVKQGTLVRWIYRDSACDAFSCGGHNIYYENGKPSGVKKGFAASNKGPTKIDIRITQKKGTTIRYFCTVNGHYMTGMTGILNVI
jgi:plastocyanin